MCSMEVHVPQWEGAVSGIFSGIFRHFHRINLNGQHEVRNVFNSCVKS